MSYRAFILLRVHSTLLCSQLNPREHVTTDRFTWTGSEFDRQYIIRSNQQGWALCTQLGQREQLTAEMTAANVFHPFALHGNASSMWMRTTMDPSIGIHSRSMLEIYGNNSVSTGTMTNVGRVNRNFRNFNSMSIHDWTNGRTSTTSDTYQMNHWNQHL